MFIALLTFTYNIAEKDCQSLKRYFNHDTQYRMISIMVMMQMILISVEYGDVSILHPIQQYLKTLHTTKASMSFLPIYSTSHKSLRSAMNFAFRPLFHPGNLNPKTALKFPDAPFIVSPFPPTHLKDLHHLCSAQTSIDSLFIPPRDDSILHLTTIQKDPLFYWHNMLQGHRRSPFNASSGGLYS